MNYMKHYNSLITKALRRELPNHVYTEKHHILPHCMGGSDTTENLVHLTFREHFIAHHLLWRAYRNRGLAAAFTAMSMKSHCTAHRQRLTSRQFESIKTARREVAIGRKMSEESKAKRKNTYACRPPEWHKAVRDNIRAGRLRYIAQNPPRKCTDAQKRMYSEAAKLRESTIPEEVKAARTETMSRTKRTPENRALSSERFKAIARNRSDEEKAAIEAKRRAAWSQKSREEIAEIHKRITATKNSRSESEKKETRRKRREAQLAVPKKTCPHCGKQARIPMFSRWHGDKCRERQSAAKPV